MPTAPASAYEFFVKTLPETLAAHADKIGSAKHVFHFCIAGDKPQNWTVDTTCSPPKVSPDLSGKSECTVKMKETDLLDLLANPSKGMGMFFSGALKADGNITLLTKLTTVLGGK